MLIKFCGLRTATEINWALELKADFYGLIFHEKSPRYVSPETASRFPAGDAKRVGVFVDNDPEKVSQIAVMAQLDYIQLHGDQSAEFAKRLGASRIIRVLWPQRYSNRNELMTEAEKYADSCELFLLDAGLAGGGSGKTMYWKILDGLSLPHPWLLAGGINIDNLNTALRNCSPFGIDINSGAEDAPGLKSFSKMSQIANLVSAGKMPGDSLFTQA